MILLFDSDMTIIKTHVDVERVSSKTIDFAEENVGIPVGKY